MPRSKKRDRFYFTAPVAQIEALSAGELFDMMRYDRAQAEDVIQQHVRTADSQRVYLFSTGPVGPTPQRWSSFGVRIELVDERAAYAPLDPMAYPSKSFFTSYLPTLAEGN